MKDLATSAHLSRAKPDKAMIKAAEASAGWPSVRAFLQSHPNLMREDPELLSKLGLRIDAANVVEFGPAALARHIDAHRRESSARLALEATAQANFSAQAQCHAGVIDLLGSRNAADLALRLDETATLRFGLAAGALAVEGAAPTGWRALDDGMVDMILGEQRTVRLGATRFADLLFPDCVQPIESCALIRLTLWRPAQSGVLAFGSTDPLAFSTDMGAELIAFIARVVERTAERWPPIL
jgi:uncharacterized protein YigA (DUF484 family)